MLTRRSPFDLSRADVAVLLRIGLGLVFVIGGYTKLSQLLDPIREAAILATYLSPLGYINAFFAEFLFTGPLGTVLTPWTFLTALSTFELVSGLALIAGLMVRPLALIFGFLLWSFVFALPVVTAPGVDLSFEAIRAPAMLVQARDIAISGLLFVLYNLGSGRYSLDEGFFGEEARAPKANWESMGLLLRLSLSIPVMIGGVFAGMDHIQSFATDPVILILLGCAMTIGVAPRLIGPGLVLVMLWFIIQTVDLDRSLIANLNAVKRELAFVASGMVLAIVGGGSRFTLGDIWARLELAKCIVLLKHFGRRCLPRFGRLR